MKKTSRRSFGKQLGLAIFAILFVSLAVLFVSLVAQTQDVPKKKDGDSPIMVGGGGGTKDEEKKLVGRSYVRFDPDFFTTTDTGNERHFKLEGEELKYIEFDDDLGSQPRNLSSYLVRGHTIKLKFRDSGKWVKITSNPLGVIIKQDEFDEVLPGDHQSPTLRLKSIEFKIFPHVDLQVGPDWKICASKYEDGHDCARPR